MKIKEHGYAQEVTRLEFAEKERDAQQIHDDLKADLKRNSRGYVKLEEFKQQLYG